MQYQEETNIDHHGVIGDLYGKIVITITAQRKVLLIFAFSIITHTHNTDDKKVTIFFLKGLYYGDNHNKYTYDMECMIRFGLFRF